MTDGIFDNFTADDFMGSAITHIRADQELFDRFVETCVFGTAMAFSAQGGTLTYPTIVVADEEHTWFLTNPGGRLDTVVVQWLREQVSEHQATMFFYAVQTVVDTDRSAEIEASTVTDASVPGVYFYAAHRTGSWFERRAGVAKKQGRNLGPFVPGVNPSAVFDSVMA